MLRSVRRFGLLGLFPYARIRGAHHLLAEVDADQVILEDVVIEHVLGRFAEVDDPLAERGRLDAKGHVLRIHRARRVIVAADPADATGNEVRVARVFALHENGIAAKDGRRAMALRDFSVLEVDLGKDAEAPHDARDGIPVHLYELARFALAASAPRGGNSCHRNLKPWGDSRS